MTKEEAIKAFKPIVDNEAYTDNFQDACKMAIEALDKQIPKKPIFEREQTSPFGVDDVPYCPNCRCELPEVSYCEKCGQRILWEVEE